MEKSEELEISKAYAYRIGLTILILLVVLTIGEYALGAVGANWTSVFIAIALFKAFLVVRDYMHIGKLFSGEEQHHE